MPWPVAAVRRTLLAHLWQAGEGMSDHKYPIHIQKGVVTLKPLIYTQMPVAHTDPLMLAGSDACRTQQLKQRVRMNGCLSKVVSLLL